MTLIIIRYLLLTLKAYLYRYKAGFAWLTYCIISTTAAVGQSPVPLPISFHTFYLASYSQIFTDTTCQFSLKQVQRADSFRPVAASDVQLGFSPACHWLRFAIISPADQTYYLNLYDCMLDQVIYFQTDNKGRTNSLMLGDTIPFFQRPVSNRNFVIPLYLRAQQPSYVYLKVSSRDAIQLALTLQKEQAFIEANTIEYLFLGLYLGAGLLVMIYNLLLFGLVRDRTYLYYFLFLMPFFFSTLSIEGLSFQYVWPQWPHFANMANTFFSGLATSACIWFSMYFLNLKDYVSRPVLYVFYLFVSLGLIISITACIAYTLYLNIFIAFYLLASCLLLPGAGFYVWRKGFRPGGFYLAGWSIFFVFAAIFMLRNASLITSDFLVMPHGYQAAFLMQQIIFSYGIGYRLREYKHDKEQSQIRLLEQQLENEQTRNRIARDLHDDIGSTLSSISILSGLPEKQVVQSNLTAIDLLTRIHHYAQNSLDRMRDLVWATRTEHVHLDSLTARMREFAAPVLEARGIDFDFRVEEDMYSVKLATHANYDIYVAFKEAVNNTIKYAGATRLEVDICRLPGKLTIRIADNGCGFDIGQVKRGNGLSNIEKRCRTLKGEYLLLSHPGQGTTVEIKIPV